MDGTGNPVFDFKAGQRRRAAAVQRWLLRLGLLAWCAGGIAWCAGRLALLTRETAWQALAAGALLCFASALWGFWWRNRLREEFRKAHS